jgi:hypothetical protein
MHDTEYKQDRRKQARLGQLGSNKPCVICGEVDPRVLQAHHPGGRKYTDEAIILCLNHHGKAEELRKDHPPELTGPPSELECDGRQLLGMGDLLSLIERVPPETVDLIRQTAFRLIDRGQLSQAGEEG